MSCPLSPADRERFAMERDLLGYLPRCGKAFNVSRNFPDDGNLALEVIAYTEPFREFCTLPKGHSGPCTCCFSSKGSVSADGCFARSPGELPLDFLARYSEISCCS